MSGKYNAVVRELNTERWTFFNGDETAYDKYISEHSPCLHTRVDKPVTKNELIKKIEECSK